MAIYSPITGGPVGSGLLPVLTPPSANELLIYNAISLLGWWRADHGLEINGANTFWINRKGHQKLVPLVAGVAPTLVASAYNGLPAIQGGTSAVTLGALTDNGANLMPVSASYTMVYVGRRGTGDASLISSSGTPTWAWHRAADDKVEYLQLNTNLGIGTAVVPPTAPHIGVLSYDYTGKEARLRINRSQVLTKTGVAVENAGPRLQLLYRGDPPVTNWSFGAQLFEVMLFSSALHLSANAALLAAVETYLNARYGVG